VILYTSIYIYRILRKNIETFLDIQHQATEIYKQYGALDDETFAPVDLEAKYGCLAFTDALELAEDETLYISLSRFNDKAHHNEVMAKVDADARIGQLFEKITGILEVSRLVRGEFERKV
jgi:uncharacterized protein YbaA (DUF1428 family)